MARESWQSRIGFTMAAAGSAVGLINIWRFPYVVGAYGGGAFILVYLMCLVLIGLPVFLAEVVLGRTAASNPAGTFRKLGGNRAWAATGKGIVITGFLVSSFYSAIAGWILGYLYEIATSGLSQFGSCAAAAACFAQWTGSTGWTLSFHALFLLICAAILLLGVKRGIEWGNKFLMPLLFVLLIFICIKGLMLPGASKGLAFLFTPDWSVLTPTSIIIALGHSFFTLSLGQGTMITYGGYLSRKDSIPLGCVPVLAFDTLISLLAGIAVFTVVFSVGLEPSSGPSLMFNSLPLVFSSIPGGHLVALLFFFLVVIAAITSEISVLEPVVAYFMDEKKWSRRKAVTICALAAFAFGIPSALSTNLMRDATWMGLTFFDLVSSFTTNLLIPLGGLAAVLLAGWRWGFHRFWAHLEEGTAHMATRYHWLKPYFWVGVKVTAPLLILLVLIANLLS